MNDPRARRASIAGWGGSLALHGLALLLGAATLVPLDTGFEFRAPDQIELGLVEGVEVEAEALAPAAAETPPPPTAPSEAREGEGSGPRERPDAGPPRDAAPRRRARDGGVDAAAPGVAGGTVVAFLPAGAQLALRLDMDRIRASPIGEEIRALLEVIPDWQALLGGSGVEPLRDLSRVLVATPTLRRETVVVAGRLAPEAGDPREIAERLGQASGVEVRWEERAGLQVAPWPSPDPTPRQVALLGERHFVIARPDDLPRVLAVAAARRRSVPAADAAEALLSMGQGEGLSIEVENVAAFTARSPCPVPLRLRAGLVETEDGTLLRGEARFDEAAHAEEARGCLAELAERGARNLLVAAYGLDGPLERLDFVADGEALRFETSLRYEELRTIARLLRGLLTPPPRPTLPAPPPSTAPPAPSTP